MMHPVLICSSKYCQQDRCCRTFAKMCTTVMVAYWTDQSRP